MILLKIAGSVLFIIGIIFYVIFAVRKSNRDFEHMQRSSREHAQWMIDFGGIVERNRQLRQKGAYPDWAIDAGRD
jgi:hypothetical protein